MEPTWNLTVRSEMKSRSAISAFLRSSGEEREHLEFPWREAPVLRDVFLAVYALEQPVSDGRLEQ